MGENAWREVGEGFVGTVRVVAVVAKDLDLAFLTREGVNDGLETWLFALGRGAVGTAVGAAYGLVRSMVWLLKELCWLLNSSTHGSANQPE